MEEQNAIVQRIFTAAAAKTGSRARLAEQLGVPYEELGLYMHGEAVPSEEVLQSAAALIGDELRRIRLFYSLSAWRSLNLPG